MYSAKITCMFMQIFILSTGASTRKTDYCKLCAVPGTHTLCLYPTDKLGPDCTSHKRMPLTKREKKAVLDLHNSHRNELAMGTIPLLPEAADMFEMTWDDELEEIAQRWANQCKLQHDKCRDSERFPVGQNFGSAPKVSLVGDIEGVTVGLVITKWLLEAISFETSGIDEYEGDHSNYAQMIWSRSKRIGCGRVGTEEEDNIFCNYGPAGNIKGEYVYKKGPACSACPSGSHCSNKYPGLCSGTTHQVQFLQLGITVQTFVMTTLWIML